VVVDEEGDDVHTESAQARVNSEFPSGSEQESPELKLKVTN